MDELTQTVMKRIDALGRVTDEPGHLTRTFCSPAMKRANALVAGWMRQAGMQTRMDAVGNLIGHFAGESKSKRGGGAGKVLLVGSHLDTVRQAGKFDGALGVLVGIACAQALHDKKQRLPFGIEVVAFADEEGVRYGSTYLGSKALAGTFDRAALTRKDADGVTMAEAIRKFGGDPRKISAAKVDARRLVGYVEVHIEQGPVLQEKDLAAGVVSAISGQSRAECRFRGKAGHAGTVPMKLRKDALCAAAEFALAVEHRAKMIKELVATVGELKVQPGASNVIPGEVVLSLDVRHPENEVRQRAFAQMKDLAVRIAATRKEEVTVRRTHEAGSVSCDAELSQILKAAVKKRLGDAVSMPSGAGHDGAAMAAVGPVAMLFVRCKDGISHHPDESVKPADVHVAIDVMNGFIEQLAKNGGRADA